MSHGAAAVLDGLELAAPGDLALVLGWTVAGLAALVGLGLYARLGRLRGSVARAAHEIRGPLCAARLALGGGPDARRLLAVDLELRRAGLAVDDLTAAPSPPRREAVDLAALVGAAAATWRAAAAAHGALLQVDAPAGAWLEGDPLRLAQALANLVANAAEHGGGTVRVWIRAAGDRVVAGVADDGPGLPAPLETLLARPARGTRGHGLRVAATVADAHGGRLAAARTPAGACLLLDLPAAGSPGP